MQVTSLKFLVFLLALPVCVYASEPVWDANKVKLKSEKLAEGVYAVYPEDAGEINKNAGAAATSGGFIFGSRSVLLIETMLNKRLSNQIQALAKKGSGKNITFAVNTSSHGDHVFGNMYLPKFVKVIQHVVTQEYIAAHTDDDKKFMIQNFGSGRGIEEIKGYPADVLVPTNGKLVLDLGNRKVEIIDFGFGQTGGDLFIWEPGSKTMWAGNAIVAPKPGVPWLLDGHVAAVHATLQKVYDFLPADARIIPGHGLAITREDIKWHIDYLEALERNVKSAIAAGATEKDIAAKVLMPEFSGYKIYGWIHSAVNVPAAYREFKK